MTFLLTQQHPNAAEALELIQRMQIGMPPVIDSAFSDLNISWRIVINDTSETRRDTRGRKCGAWCAKIYRDERLVGLLDLRDPALCEFLGNHGDAICRALRKHLMSNKSKAGDNHDNA